FYVDNQGLVKALENGNWCTDLVWNCFDVLNTLSDRHKVTVNWIPVHSGYEENETVDLLAKEATTVEFVGAKPVVAVSEQKVKTAIKSWVLKKHASYWKNLYTCFDTKKFLPSYDMRFVRIMESQSRKKVK